MTMRDTTRPGRVRSALTLTLLALVLLTLAACGGEPVEDDGTEAAGAAGGTAAEPTTRGATGEGTPIEARGLVFDLPSSWVPEAPSSSMRIAQASVPGSAGAGQLSVFHFGVGGGGGVEANLQRWIGQMERSDPQEPERMSVEAGEFRATWVDVSGTLRASNIGSFPPADMPDYRLFGAVVEGPGGPWFFRVVGPEATLAEHRDAFVGLLESARAAE